MLFQVTLGLAGLEPLERARNRRKASVKTRRNPSRHQTDQVQQTLYNPTKGTLTYFTYNNLTLPQHIQA